MKRFIAISVGILAAFCAIVFGLLWFHNRSCYNNTVYSERFATKAFESVTIGMPRSTLVEILGAPLSTSTNERWPVSAIEDETTRNRYGKDNEISAEFLMFSQPKDQYHDFHSVSVSVGPDNKVIGTWNFITD